jgi:prepilin-type N-terminal cleavage/methylation domain-containing protein
MNRLSRRKASHGFTLLELLVVIAVVVILSALVYPAVSSLMTSSSFTGSVTSIDGLLREARSFAMAHDEYTYIGFVEIDGLAPLPTPGSAQAATAGVGRVAVAIISPSDASSGFDSNSSSNPIWTNYGTGTGFIALSPIKFFNNIHIADLGTPPSSGGMARPTAAAADRLGNAACTSITPFAWPLGRSLNAGQYNFTLVIKFSPQGAANIVSSSGATPPQEIEIGLQPTHGNTLPPSTVTNQAAIQIAGVTGSTIIYRP